MEGIFAELEIGLGTSVTALAFLVLAFGGILMGHLADLQKAGKRFFWTEAPVPGPDLRAFLPKELQLLKAA